MRTGGVEETFVMGKRAAGCWQRNEGEGACVDIDGRVGTGDILKRERRLERKEERGAR